MWVDTVWTKTSNLSKIRVRLSLISYKYTLVVVKCNVLFVLIFLKHELWLDKWYKKFTGINKINSYFLINFWFTSFTIIDDCLTRRTNSQKCSQMPCHQKSENGWRQPLLDKCRQPGEDQKTSYGSGQSHMQLELESWSTGKSQILCVLLDLPISCIVISK